MNTENTTTTPISLEEEDEEFMAKEAPTTETSSEEEAKQVIMVKDEVKQNGTHSLRSVSCSPPSDLSLQDAVVAQMEFYLSESNLPQDKFLFKIWTNSFNTPSSVVLNTPIPGDYVENKKLSEHWQSSHSNFHLGWIPLNLLTNFSRMKIFLEPQPVGLGGVEGVVAALKSKSKLVEAYLMGNLGEEGAGWFVRRTKKFSKPVDVFGRTIYAKGFPIPEPVKDESIEEKERFKKDELELQTKLEVWARGLKVGKVVCVKMRREAKPPLPGAKSVYWIANRGPFKGSIFLEFAAQRSVVDLMAMSPKPTFEGQELEIMTKTDYVEMKRKLYAPLKSEAETSTSSTSDRTSHNADRHGHKVAKPFNAYDEDLIGPYGFPKPLPIYDPTKPKVPNKKKGKTVKVEDIEVLYDGVSFTARRIGGKEGVISIVDEEDILPKWETSKLLCFTLATKDGAIKEYGERFDFPKMKMKVAPICKPGFVALVEKETLAIEDRKIAPLPSSLPAAKMELDWKPEPLTPVPSTSTSTASDVKPTLPTDVKPSATDVKPSATDVKPTLPVAYTSESNSKFIAVKRPRDPTFDQEYPANGTASFREVVTDEILAKIQSDLGVFNDRPVTWTRASEELERAHIRSRAQYHAAEAFKPKPGKKKKVVPKGNAQRGSAKNKNKRQKTA